MYIIILINTNNTRRAFLKFRKNNSVKFIKEMEDDGWLFSSMDKVDCIMHGTLKIINQ